VSLFQRLNRRTKIVVATLTVSVIIVSLAVWRPWQHRETRTASIDSVPPTISESIATPPPPPPTVEPTSAAAVPPTGAAGRQITYSVTGTKAPNDVITVTYTDASGRQRRQQNVYIPWTLTLTPISQSDVGSVQASSFAGVSRLNCSITASDGTVLSERSDNSPVTSC